MYLSMKCISVYCYYFWGNCLLLFFLNNNQTIHRCLVNIWNKFHISALPCIPYLIPIQYASLTCLDTVNKVGMRFPNAKFIIITFFVEFVHTTCRWTIPFIIHVGMFSTPAFTLTRTKYWINVTNVKLNIYF